MYRKGRFQILSYETKTILTTEYTENAEKNMILNTQLIPCIPWLKIVKV